MDSNMDMSREEMERLLEEARKKAMETLAKMTPEEREQSLLKWQKAIEEDRASMQALVEEAAKVAGGDIPQSSPADTAPRFCPNCGAPAEGGKFCAYCGKPLNEA